MRLLCRSARAAIYAMQASRFQTAPSSRKISKTPSLKISLADVRRIQSPNFREFLARYYYDVIANTPRQAAAAQRAELDQNAKIVKEFGIISN